MLTSLPSDVPLVRHPVPRQRTWIPRHTLVGGVCPLFWKSVDYHEASGCQENRHYISSSGNPIVPFDEITVVLFVEPQVFWLKGISCELSGLDTAMGDELLILLALAATCGTMMGGVLTLLYTYCRSKGLSKGEVTHQKKCGIPSEIWISHAGQQFHLHSECPSLQVDGRQRRGVNNFKLCAHCSKHHSSEAHDR